MKCRKGCAACCIAPSISSAMPGMPEGKLAGERCLHLDENLLCCLFGDSRRPAVCENFQPVPENCGDNAEMAMKILTFMELQTR